MTIISGNLVNLNQFERIALYKPGTEIIIPSGEVYFYVRTTTGINIGDKFILNPEDFNTTINIDGPHISQLTIPADNYFWAKIDTEFTKDYIDAAALNIFNSSASNMLPLTGGVLSGILQVPKIILTGNGTINDAAISFFGDINTGIYRNAIDEIRFTVDGTNPFNISNSGITADNITTTGNLTVTGNVTQLDSTILNVNDNYMRLNSNVIGPNITSYIGIQAGRGTLGDSYLVFDESIDKWRISEDNGVTYHTILTHADIASSLEFSTKVNTHKLVNLDTLKNHYEFTQPNQTAFGQGAGSTSIINNQTALGRLAGNSAIGDGQTVIGANSGTFTTGIYNTIIGYNSGNVSSGANVTVIGNNSNNNTTFNNTITIGNGLNSTSNDQILIGDINNKTITIHGQYFSDDGTPSQPTYTFGSDIDTGMYQFSDGITAFTSNGSRVVNIGYDATGSAMVIEGNSSITIPVGQIVNRPSIPEIGMIRYNDLLGNYEGYGVNGWKSFNNDWLDGTEALPGVSFVNDTDTGFYRYNSGSFGVTLNGVKQVNFEPGQSIFHENVLINGDLNVLGTQTNIGTANLSISDNMIVINSGETNPAGITLVTSGISVDRGPILNDAQFWYDEVTDRWQAGINGSMYNILTEGFPIGLNDGTAVLPGAFFLNDTDTGIYRVGNNNIGITTGGISRMEVGNTEIKNNLPTLFPDGTVGSPSISFINDTDTGFYKSAPNTIDLSIGGMPTQSINNTRISYTSGTGYTINTGNNFEINSSTTSTTNKLSSAINNTALTHYQTASLNRWVVGKDASLELGANSGSDYDISRYDDAGSLIDTPLSINRATGLTTINNMRAGWADGLVNAPDVYFTNDTDTGIYRPIANNLAITAGGVNVAQYGSIISNNVVCRFIDGSVGVPSISFTNDTDTGLYRVGSNNIGITAGGINVAQFADTYITNTVRTLFADGTVGSPSISFINDQDTGLYRSASNEISITTGGVLSARFSSGVTTINNGLNIPAGNTTQRIAGAGAIRYNYDTGNFEGYDANTATWINFGGAVAQGSII